ncbi:MAG: hypothetical protein RLZZ501_633, partial [Pseudomonadota bacterium]
MTDVARSRLVKLHARSMRRQRGRAWGVPLPPDLPAGDSEQAPRQSLLRLFEDGVELCPGHTSHEEIARLGGGRFSHWGQELWFSSRDGSWPVANLRSYQALIPAEMMVAAGDGPLARAVRTDLASLSDFEKFRLARELYHAIWPQTVLPDFGRWIDQDQDFAAIHRLCAPEGDLTHDRKFG